MSLRPEGDDSLSNKTEHITHKSDVVCSANELSTQGFF